MVAIKKIAGIILVILVLFILIFALTGLFEQIFGKGIKEIFKEKTDSEITSEQNTKAIKAFENLETQITKCQDSKENNCGCLVDLSKFGNNHRINFSNNEMKLINLKNIRDNLKEDEGIQMDHLNIKLNCYWDNNFKMEFFTIMVLGENQYIFKKIWGWTSITRRGHGYSFIHNFNILKINNKLCWLTDQVKEKEIQNIKECQ